MGYDRFDWPIFNLYQDSQFEIYLTKFSWALARQELPKHFGLTRWKNEIQILDTIILLAFKVKVKGQVKVPPPVPWSGKSPFFVNLGDIGFWKTILENCNKPKKNLLLDFRILGCNLKHQRPQIKVNEGGSKNFRI